MAGFLNIKSSASCPNNGVHLIKGKEGIDVTSLKTGLDWLINHGFYRKTEVDPYVARFVLNHRWPVRYLIFIKAKCNLERDPAKNELSYQRILANRLESVFFDIRNENDENDPTKEITLLEARNLLGFSFDMVLTVLADHEDSVGDFVTKYLHVQPEIADTHTATSLVTKEWLNFRNNFEAAWLGNSELNEDSGV